MRRQSRDGWRPGLRAQSVSGLKLFFRACLCCLCPHYQFSPRTDNIGRLGQSNCEHGILATCKYTCKTDGVKKYFHIKHTYLQNKILKFILEHCVNKIVFTCCPVASRHIQTAGPHFHPNSSNNSSLQFKSRSQQRLTPSYRYLNLTQKF